MSNQRNIIVIGGGAAGMIAAIAAAKEGCAVSLYEKNEKLGKKIFITGKGRCNVTNAGDMDELFAAVITNKKFMFSSFYGFTNEDMMQFLEDAGLRLKTERGKRVFPLSDHSSDVIAALDRTLKKENVKVYLRKEVKGLNFITEEDKTICKGIFLDMFRYVIQHRIQTYNDRCISFADFFNKLINHNCFLLEFIFFIFLLYIITNIIHETNDLIKCFLHIHLDIFRSGRYNSTHRRREP